MVGTGIPCTCPVPMKSAPGANRKRGIPSVTMKARPRAMPIMPSVATNGGIRSFPTHDAVGQTAGDTDHQARYEAGIRPAPCCPGMSTSCASGPPIIPSRSPTPRSPAPAPTRHSGRSPAVRITKVLAGAQHAEHCGLDCHLQQVVLGEKIGRKPRETEHHDEQDDEHEQGLVGEQTTGDGATRLPNAGRHGPRPRFGRGRVCFPGRPLSSQPRRVPAAYSMSSSWVASSCGTSATMRPSRMTKMRSLIRSTSGRSDEIRITVPRRSRVN